MQPGAALYPLSSNGIGARRQVLASRMLCYRCQGRQPEGVDMGGTNFYALSQQQCTLCEA